MFKMYHRVDVYVPVALLNIQLHCKYDKGQQCLEEADSVTSPCIVFCWILLLPDATATPL